MYSSETGLRHVKESSNNFSSDGDIIGYSLGSKVNINMVYPAGYCLHLPLIERCCTIVLQNFILLTNIHVLVALLVSEKVHLLCQ